MVCWQLLVPSAWTLRVGVSIVHLFLFFFNDAATTEISPLSLRDALPICRRVPADLRARARRGPDLRADGAHGGIRSEEHTSELQPRFGTSYAVFCLKKWNSLGCEHRLDRPDRWGRDVSGRDCG